jgi:hypothetical protein
LSTETGDATIPGIILSCFGFIRGHHAAVACPHLSVYPVKLPIWEVVGEVHFGRIRDPWRVRLICRIREYYYLPGNKKRKYRPINLLLSLCLNGNQRGEATSSWASLTYGSEHTKNEEGGLGWVGFVREYPGANLCARVSACLRIAARPLLSKGDPRKPNSSKSTAETRPPTYLQFVTIAS